MKNKARLSGTLEAGCTQLISLPPTVQLENKGGLITVLDKNALKVEGVSCAKEQAKTTLDVFGACHARMHAPG
jgi:hypothetical protein